jgi:hypothetical protein
MKVDVRLSAPSFERLPEPAKMTLRIQSQKRPRMMKRLASPSITPTSQLYP